MKAFLARALGRADVVPDIPWAAVVLDDYRMRVAGGREGLPWSCGSIFAASVARCLSRSSMDPRRCDVLLPEEPSSCVLDVTAYRGSDSDGRACVCVAALTSYEERFESRPDFRSTNVGAYMHTWSYPSAAAGVLVPVTSADSVALFALSETAAAAPRLAIMDSTASVNVVTGRRVGWQNSLTLENPDPDDFCNTRHVASSTVSGLIAVLGLLPRTAGGCARVVVYRASDGHIVCILPGAAEVDALRFTSVCFLPDGLQLALATARRVYIFDATTGAYVRTIDVGAVLGGAGAPGVRLISDFGNGIACTNARELCALSREYRRVYVIDVDTCALVATLQPSSSVRESAAAGMPDAEAAREALWGRMRRLTTHGNCVFGVNDTGVVFVWPRW
jgi:hypothetical protein